MADSHENREARRLAGAALAAQAIPELRDKVGGKAREMAERMSSEDLSRLAYPELAADKPKIPPK